MPGKYKYLPLRDLQEVRLLHIQPGEWNIPISCHITNATLEAPNLEYEALSYTWGHPKKEIPIICNDEGDTLFVTRNCELALRRLRDSDNERTIWIDAVSIDQDNYPERNEQVRLMAEIYRRARKVVVYLGEASGDSDFAMDYIQRDNTDPFDRPSLGLGPNNPSSPAQRAVDSLIRRDYFTRVWILQEVKFANEIEVVCGDRAVSWTGFARTVKHVDTNKRIHCMNSSYTAPPQVIDSRSQTRPDAPETLLQFLEDTRHCNASDARDKVYALIGMTPESNEPALNPNYSPENTPRDTYIALTKYMIMRDHNLDVLCQAHGTPLIEDLPSWVPDWSSHTKSATIGYPKPSPRFKAAKGFRTAVSFSPDLRILTARGKCVDNIARLGPTYESGQFTYKELREWEQMARDTNPKAPTEDTRKALLETVMAATAPGNPDIPNPHMRLFASPWYTQMMAGGVSTEKERGSAVMFNIWVVRACNGRRFCVTKNGDMGLVPEESQVGDMICIFLGGQVPFVLRDDNDKQYRFIGECYIRGLMQGEGLVGIESVDDTTLEEFPIR